MCITRSQEPAFPLRGKGRAACRKVPVPARIIKTQKINMALIKSSECGRDVSDKAASCPNCGNRISPANPAVVQLANVRGQHFHVQPELTSKKWKKVKIVAGCIMASSRTGIRRPKFQCTNRLHFFIGAIVMIIASIGAWYADKRTRVKSHQRTNEKQNMNMLKT